MDIVYVYKESSRNKSEELRYSMRSLENLRHDQVWLVGDKPPWAKNVNFINVYQGGSSWNNVHQNIRRVCRYVTLSDEFIFFNDDFYVMKKFDEMPTLHGGPLNSLRALYREGENHHYAKRVRATSNYLGPEALNYDIHVPMVLNKHKIHKALDHSQDKLFRSVYGNKYKIGGDYYKDTKVRSKRHPAPAATHEEIVSSPFISSSNTSFSESFVGEFIRDQFHRKSNYER